MVPDPVPDWFELRQRARRMGLPSGPEPECVVDSDKPCWVARCRHSLLTDDARGGDVRETFPDTDPAKLRETCSVRVARNGIVDGDAIRDPTISEIAEMMGMSTQNARLAMLSAFAKIAEVIEPGQLVRYWRAKRTTQGR